MFSLPTPDSDGCWNRRFWAFLGSLLLLRLLAAAGLCTFAGLAGDEAYYWDWGRSPAWGYYSKPPMIGWIMSLIGHGAGASALAVRLTAVGISTGSLVMVWLLMRRLWDERVGFLSALAVALTPAHLGLSLFLTIDAPLLLCWTSALCCFVACLESPHRPLPWLLLWLVLGVGMLSKQIMLVLPLLFLGFCGTFAQERGLLRRPALWISTLGSLLFLVPVLMWQREHQWITLTHTAEHFHGMTGGLWAWLRRTAEWPLIQGLIYTPPLCVGAVVCLWRLRTALGSHSLGTRLLWFCSAPALIVFSLLALRQRVNPNWPAVFWLPALLLAVAFFAGARGMPKAGLRWNRVVWTTLAAATLIAHAALMAVGFSSLSEHPKLGELVGWDEVAKQVSTFHEKCPQGRQTPILALGHRYLAAQLAFAMPGHPRCFRYEPKASVSSQYEIWPGLERHLGSDVLVVGSKPSLSQDLVQRFASVVLLGEVRTSQRRLWVHLGRNLRNWPSVGPRPSGRSLDFQLLHLVNVEASHPALDWLMPVLSALEIWLMPLLVLAAIACWRQPARWGRLMATMALALLLSDAVVGRSLKQFAGRQRPRDSVEGLWVRDLGKEYKGPLRLLTNAVLSPSRPRPDDGKGRSMPSNHVMNLSAAATLLVLHAPRLGPLAVGLALAVAYSRLYCAAHWPSDLPPSILLGVLCALAASNLMRRLWKGDEKGSRPVPQPKDERDSSPASDSRK